MTGGEWDKSVVEWCVVDIVGCSMTNGRNEERGVERSVVEWCAMEVVVGCSMTGRERD